MTEDKSVTLQGRDRLTVKLIGEEKITWDKLLKKCKDFLSFYEKDDYKELFPNYNNLIPASDDEIKELNTILIDAIKEKKFSKLSFCIPEFISNEDYSFSYTNNTSKENLIHSHIDISDIYKYIKDDKLSVDYLRRKYVYAYSTMDDRVHSDKKWSFFDCLVFETKLHNLYFVLSDGIWARVEVNFYNRVIDFVQKRLVVVDCPNPENS